MNGWVGELFDSKNVGRIVKRLVEAQPAARSGGDGAARRRLDEAEAKIRRFQDAIAAGIDPAAVVESINQAQADRAVAQAELANAGEPAGLSEAEIYAMIDSLGDIGAALADSEPGKLAQLYRDLALDLQSSTTKKRPSI